MTDLLDVLDRLGSPALLVLGDVMLDRTTWGDTTRVSPEAPALVLDAQRQEERLGGAAAVAALLRGLGARATLAGVRGDDEAGRALEGLLDAAAIDRTAVLLDPGRPTTLKERFLGRAAGGAPSPVLRVDRESRRPLAPHLERQLLARLTAALEEHDALLVSDYAKGVCSPGLLADVRAAAARRRMPVLIDPARLPGFGRYRGADLLAPNRAEAERATGLTIGTPEDALRAARCLCAHYDTAAALVKLDRDGLALAEAGGEAEVFAAGTRGVVDVTGAGDMVLAVAGLCRAAGVPWPAAARLANVAAGLEVERRGVVPVSREEVRADLLRRAGRGGKRVTAEQMARLADGYRRAGRRLVFTNGCFDLLHAGHVAFLQQAAALGDVLLVAVNGDASVRRLKGPGRPVIPENDRAALVAALACVGHVLVFDADTPHELLRLICPDVLVKGGTYAVEQVVGREVVEVYGGRVSVTGRRDGLSTTRLLEMLRAPPAADGAA